MRLTGDQSLKLLLCLAAAQVGFAIFAAYYGGKAQLYCAPKSNDCQQVAGYFINNDKYHFFSVLWRSTIVVSLLSAIISHSSYRFFFIFGIPLALPVYEFIPFILAIMSGF